MTCVVAVALCWWNPPADKESIAEMSGKAICEINKC